MPTNPSGPPVTPYPPNEPVPCAVPLDSGFSEPKDGQPMPDDLPIEDESEAS